jgi:integrase
MWGRAFSRDEETKLLAAASQSRSPALLPLVIISIDTGMRLGETQRLRGRDLSLVWKDAVIQRGEITVAKSKTAAGTGRMIPLSRRACACLSMWMERFPEAGPDSLLFPSTKLGWPAIRGSLFSTTLTSPVPWLMAQSVASGKQDRRR